MDNLLKTKLKGAVNDNTLPFLGKFLIRVVSLNGVNFGTLTVTNSAGCELVVSAGGAISLTEAGLTDDPKTSITIPTSRTVIYCKNGDYDIYINNKYTLTYLSVGVSGNIPSQFVCNIDELKFSPNFTVLDVKNNNGCTGDIESFVTFTALTTVGAKNTLIGGVLEKFVEGLWANSKRSGNVTVSGSDSNIVFHNAPARTQQIAFSANGVSVSTDGVAAATYDGTTWTYLN